jgi:hypothetical protein
MNLFDRKCPSPELRLKVKVPLKIYINLFWGFALAPSGNSISYDTPKG